MGTRIHRGATGGTGGALILGISLLGVAAAFGQGAGPMIPELTWEERSDWVNVRTDVSPPAVGDGLADDTAAIQAALDSVGDGGSVYLPPGMYRITDTLTLTGPKVGMLLVGHGRATRILWDGPEGGRMFWSNGIAYSRYVGIVWDGQGRAAVAFDHDAKLRFETEVRHQHEAFLNCTGYGIRVGHDQVLASAEILYENCLFERCGVGAAFLTFNDYDNTFDGCEFRDCGVGIIDSKGNFYVRNSHFERSREADIVIGSEHGSSVRRCTSVGSNRFVVERGTIGPVTIQDCHVANWIAPDGAVVLNGAPVIMLDCSFSSPPGPHPPVRLESGGQRLIISGNRWEGAESLYFPPDAGTVLALPSGTRSGAISDANRSFLKQAVPTPGKLFDAKRDFGAVGDGQADDTDAIQSTIDAARHQGNGAVAYLPTGTYKVTRTLRVHGGAYTVAGSGFRCGLVWRGPEGGTLMEITDPQEITLEQISIGSGDFGEMNNGVDILHTSSGGPSLMRYDGVFVFGMYQKQPFRKGLHLVGLSPESVAHLLHVQGNIQIRDCAQARVLVNTSYEGSIVLEGRDHRRDGIIGFLTRLCTIATYSLYVRDSQSIVMSDFYNEQGERHLHLSGNPGDPPGRVTIQGPKMHLFGGGPVAEIENYHGALVLTDQFYIEPNPMVFTQSGDNPVDPVVLGSFFYNAPPEFRVGPVARVSLVSNTSWGPAVEDQVAEGALKAIGAAFDDLRRLGELDLELNHSQAG